MTERITSMPVQSFCDLCATSRSRNRTGGVMKWRIHQEGAFCQEVSQLILLILSKMR